MSKSKGNIYTISALEKKGFHPLVYRYFCLTAHYRTQLNFTLENLTNAQNTYQKLKNIISELKDDGKINEKYLKEFEAAIDDDIDMPKALAVLWNLIRDAKAQGKVKTIEKIDNIFGLDLLKQERVAVPPAIKKLVEEREKARKDKDFKLSDKLREEIKETGYIIEDTDKGPKVKKV